jgi:UDP-3-O-[3-hydroxymyristoyl] N-acetylglucosamine deacetylase/UDP-3-O-[3-hydroxymyristoyl] N-acetylglucosamine deacetylase/3-hydroxyacyl-[acyl-carrier-protein] dehydratase
MTFRSQRTIARPAEVGGVGFLTGADVRVRFLPANEDSGIAFRRTDLAGAEPIPALVEYTVPRLRRTAIERRGVSVELIEHVMAALAGLWIDNCLVEINAPEPPGLDGSCLPFVDALLDADLVKQTSPRRRIIVRQPDVIRSEDGSQQISVTPASSGLLTIGYQLDYGPASAIPSQGHVAELTPESFARDIAFARTFILDSEVRHLQAQGYGRRTTAKDLLVFGPQGVIDNALRTDDECARHKVLDCVGDFALLGCDLVADVRAFRSGHRLNAELVRRLRLIQEEPAESPALRRVA